MTRQSVCVPGTVSPLLVVAGVFQVLAFAAAMLLLQPDAFGPDRAAPRPAPDIPADAYPYDIGVMFVDLPAGYSASLYLSPVDGGLLAEWRGGTAVEPLGMRFFDGFTDWLLVRTPDGDEGWMGEVFLSAEPPDDASTNGRVTNAGDRRYVGSVFWDGPIRYCVNPVGGPPGLDGDGFVQLVERAADRWQVLMHGGLPLAPQGRCNSDPNAHDDGITTIGWAPDLGLVIAALTYTDVFSGAAGEMDIVMSRGFFERRQARDPTRTLEACVLSTVVHELGHVLGLEHPRDRMLRSSMQGVGASRCDKSRPTPLDRENLLALYPP